MTTLNAPPNVYDEEGTVLYRAVPSNLISDDEPITAAAANAATAAAAGQEASTIPTTNRQKFGQTQSGVGGTRDAIQSDGGPVRLTQESLTPVKALAKLFPPVPLNVPGHDKDRTNTRGQEQECAWMKAAAVDHTSRLDCVHLQEHLERRCQQEHARPSGVVCTIREGIYADGMREVIRQVTVLCPERGLLLAELAEEMQQTTNTYDILFDSASQYTVRKAIERDLRSYLFKEKEWMESEVRRLENRVNELRAKHNGMLKRFEEQKQSEQKIHEEEVKYLRKANQQIINEIKRFAAVEKSSTPTPGI